jgi:hypothetical protein
VREDPAHRAVPAAAIAPAAEVRNHGRAGRSAPPLHVPTSSGWLTLHGSLPDGDASGWVAIAEQLVISPYTVQARLKAVFDKTATRSRRQLLAQVFFHDQLPASSRTTRSTLEGISRPVARSGEVGLPSGPQAQLLFKSGPVRPVAGQPTRCPTLDQVTSATGAVRHWVTTPPAGLSASDGPVPRGAALSALARKGSMVAPAVPT